MKKKLKSADSDYIDNKLLKICWKGKKVKFDIKWVKKAFINQRSTNDQSLDSIYACLHRSFMYRYGTYIIN